MERNKHTSDAQSLKDARPARKEPMVVFLNGPGFFDHNDTMQVEKNKSPVIVPIIGSVTVSTS